MKSIFQLIFLISFYVFGISSALQINDSLNVVSVDDSVLRNQVFDLGSETETSFDTDSQKDSKSVDTQAKKSTSAETAQDFYSGEVSESDTYKKTGSSGDYLSSDTSDSESTTSTQDFDKYQTFDENTSSTGETTTTTDRGSYQTMGTKSVKTNRSAPATKVMKVSNTKSNTSSNETSDSFETEDYANKDSTYTMSENYDSTNRSQSTSTPTGTEARHTGFDGEGFLKAVSKLVNIRKRTGTGSTSVTTKDYQKGVSEDYTGSNNKPGNQDNDKDDDDQDSFFKRYGIPEYVVWIIIYTVPILIILLLCITSYCCCCRR